MAEYKLDIFRVLSNLDHGNRNFYSELTDEEKKGFTALITMRWASSIRIRGDIQEHFLNYINEYVNIHFWELSKHPELQWKLMSMIGIGQKEEHAWLPMAKKEKIPSIVNKLLRQYYTTASDEEISMMDKLNSDEEIIEFARALAWNDNELKTLKSDLKKRK